MRAVKNLFQLLGEIWGFAREHKKWWIALLIVLLLSLGLVIVGFSTISPFIYSLF